MKVTVLLKKSAYVQNENATVLALLYSYLIFVILAAGQARAVVMAVAFHSGGQGSISRSPEHFFHLIHKNPTWDC